MLYTELASIPKLQWAASANQECCSATELALSYNVLQDRTQDKGKQTLKVSVKTNKQTKEIDELR